ncbi:hypothetical protein ACTQZS_07885 [Bilifractor sp. LCP19S3_H10]
MNAAIFYAFFYFLLL